LARITSGKEDQATRRWSNIVSARAVSHVSSREGDLVNEMLDSDALPDDEVKKSDKQVKLRKRKKLAQPLPLASKKRKTDSIAVREIESLSVVESKPPKVCQNLHRQMFSIDSFIAFTTPSFNVGT
jgi:hypothetical protein